MNMLWQEEEFEQICSREVLTEKAAEIEKRSLRKSTTRKGHAMLSTQKCFMKPVFGIGGQP